MNFKTIQLFQDNLYKVGYGGNDLSVYLDGKEVYRYASGFQNLEKKIKISKNTLYRMFSMSKPITAAAAMQLYEQGKFLLDDPVGDYLPEFKDLTVRTVTPNGNVVLKKAEKPMLIRHLFTMTSGIDYNLQSPSLEKLYRDTDFCFTTADYVAAIAKEPLSFEPGEHWLYGLSLDVLGRLIEVWSGLSFGEYLQKNIFDVLEMKTATFHPKEEDLERICVRYRLKDKGLEPSDQTNPYQLSDRFESGGAGLTMTVDDYAKFAYAMTNDGIGLNKKRILTRRTLDLMRLDHLTEAEYRDYQDRPDREGYSYGLGVRTLYDPAASGSPFPEGEYGWGGAWGTFTGFDPENRLCFVWGVAFGGENGYCYRIRLQHMIYAALEWEGYLD